MNLTKEQLDELEEMAFAQLTPKECAIMFEVPEVDFAEELQTLGSDVRRAYYRGHLRQVIATRRAIITAAHNGSNPAQTELLRIIRTTEKHINNG